MIKLGLFGGTFNPIHNGHLGIAKQFYQHLQLDSVLFLPAGQPYHKNSSNVSAQHRLAMVQAAIEDYSHFAVSDLDIIRQGNTYTIDTINILKQLYPQSIFYWLLGMDSLLQLHTWKHWQQLVQQTHIVVASRQHDAIQTAPDILKNWIHLATDNGSLIWLDNPEYPISSSQIRANLASGKDCSAWLPEKVNQYIQQHQLYR